MEQFFSYFDGIPPVVLYALIFVASYLEGLLPIVPGDLATAFFPRKLAGIQAAFRPGQRLVVVVASPRFPLASPTITMWPHTHRSPPSRTVVVASSQ